MTLARAVDEIEGFFAFIMLLALVGAVVWLGIARIRKLWFNRRRNTRFYKAQVTSVESYRYSTYSGRFSVTHRQFVIHFSWDDCEDGEREATLETGRRLFAWICEQSGTVRIAVIRDRRKPHTKPEPQPQEEESDLPLLSPELQKEYRRLKKQREKACGNPMNLPEEDIVFRYTRRWHVYYAIFYFVFIMLPIMLVPLMILFGWYLSTHKS